MNTRRGASWLWVLVACCGCGNEDADRLGRVCRRAAERWRARASPAGAKLARGWHALCREGPPVALEEAVRARLRHEKALANLHIEVRLVENAVVELKGEVTDSAQRTRALELANSTVGVEKVVDALSVLAE